ncbi:MAG TPA: discoidin domain-containing protein [Candidatus Kryptonia bacterium]
MKEFSGRSNSLLVLAVLVALLAVPTSAQVPKRHSWNHSAKVTVDASNRLSVINPLIYGLNVARWDEDLFPGPAQDMLLTSDQTAIRRIRQSGVTILKYPGGNDADHYTWNDPKNSAAEMNTDEYAALLAATGTEGFVTINFNESPELAAEWVAYCNKEKGYHIKYWEIGDEQWGSWARGHTTPEKYAERFISFAKAMKGADSTILVASNVMPSADTSGWTYRVLKSAGKYIDMVSFSFYPFTNKQEYEDTILTGPYRYRLAYKTIREALEEALPIADPAHGKEKADTMWIADVGYNSISGYPGPITLSIANTLYIADMIGTMAQLGEQISCYWALHNSYPPRHGDYGILSEDGKGRRNFVYYVFPLFTRYFGRDLVNSTCSDTSLSVYSSLTGNDTLSIILINKNKRTAARADIELKGFTAQGSPTALILNSEHKLDKFDALKHTASVLSENIPPYSIVVLQLQREGAVPPPENLALGARATASSFALNGPDFGPSRAVDGKQYTRWASSALWGKEGGLDEQWFELDFGKQRKFNTIVLHWSEGHGVQFIILVSPDKKNWHTVVQEQQGAGGTQNFGFEDVRARFIKLICLKGTHSVSTYSINEFEIYDYPKSLRKSTSYKNEN